MFGWFWRIIWERLKKYQPEPEPDPVNEPPVVDAGPDRVITLPMFALLEGAATDDGLPNHLLNTKWVKVSGPSTVEFEDDNAMRTKAYFGEAGTYILKLTADDGDLVETDEVTFVVNPHPEDPPDDPGPTPTGEEVVLFIPGWMGTVGNFSALIDYLADRGYDRNNLFTKGLSDRQRMCHDAHIDEIEEEVQRILKATGAKKISLVGYSAGGGAVYNFMHFGASANVVEDLILMAGTADYPCPNYGERGQDATPHTALHTTIFSPSDGIVPVAWSDIDGAKNVTLQSVNHLQFIRNNKVFEQVHLALQGGGANE